VTAAVTPEPAPKPVYANVGLYGKAEPERRRGRPKGARNSRDTKSLQNIETMLLAVHAMAAMYVGIPELKLDKDDAKTLAEALANVGQYHHVKLDGRTGAYLGLLFAVGKVYGPMGIMAYNKLRNSNNANKAP
jgi:hypothetical protein